MSNPHPDQVLVSLKEKARRSNKVRNLSTIHDTCADVFKSGGTDFSYALIGRMSEQRGGPVATTLYTQASADYRSLIDAWAEYAKAHAKRRPVKPQFATDDELLRKVEDPAVRALLAMAVAERNRFRAQLDTLRSQANVTIDLRPLAGMANVDTRTGEVIQVISPLDGITEAEIDALAHAVTTAFIAAHGWTEGENGKIVSASGNTIYRAGYTHAIRRVVDAARSARTTDARDKAANLRKQKARSDVTEA